MNKIFATLGIVGVLAIGIGTLPIFADQGTADQVTDEREKQDFISSNFVDNFQGSMMGEGFGSLGFQNGMMSGGMMGNGTMWGGELDSYTGDVMEDDSLIVQVEQYIGQFDANLELGDLFKYTNTEYYVSVEDKDTGLGAFELLINPYTGFIRPEQGPNMMWNEQYSMMSGMHGSFFNGNGEMISQEKAMAAANKYLQLRDSSLHVTEEGHKFSGYYTLHVEQDGEPYGMLSVHGTTGEVWYHTWHGELTEVVSLHNDEH